MRHELMHGGWDKMRVKWRQCEYNNSDGDSE